MAKKRSGPLTKAQLAACPRYVGRCPHCGRIQASMIVLPGSEKESGRLMGEWLGRGLKVQQVEDVAAWRAELGAGMCEGNCQAEPMQPQLFAEVSDAAA